MEGIKVGDIVRVSEDAPSLYTNGWFYEWMENDSSVLDINGEDALIGASDGCYSELAIPTKYLVKVNAESKEPTIKVGDTFKGGDIKGRVEYVNGNRIGVITDDGWHIEVLLYDTEGTIEETPDDVIFVEHGVNSEPKEKPDSHTITIPVEADLTDSFWKAYEADLAKEIALKVANKFNAPHEAAEYAVSIAKAVVEGLKRK